MDSAPELTQIIRENEAPLLRYACRILKDPDGARDAVQEAFIRFVRHVQKEGVEVVANPTAWLYRTTRNYCLDHLRSKRVKVEVTLDETLSEIVPDDTESPDNTVADVEEMQLLRQMINELEPRDREILILKIEQEKSYKEIAEIMDLSVSNVGFILHNVIKKLQKKRKLMAEAT